MIKPGRYRHYKGKDYEVLGVARHSETEEEYVVYRQLYREGGLWIRPLTMFSESVSGRRRGRAQIPAVGGRSSVKRRRLPPAMTPARSAIPHESLLDQKPPPAARYSDSPVIVDIPALRGRVQASIRAPWFTGSAVRRDGVCTSCSQVISQSVSASCDP